MQIEGADWLTRCVCLALQREEERESGNLLSARMIDWLITRQTLDQPDKRSARRRLLAAPAS